MKVISKERGLRQLKKGVSFETYKDKYPSARKAKVPSMKTLEKWNNDGMCKTPCGCRVEPDGICSHGWDSWLTLLGWI